MSGALAPVASKAPRPGIPFLIFQTLMPLLLMIYVWGLPFWSPYANDTLGQAGRFCTMPAAELTRCGNTGENYLEMAERLERYNDKNELVGCRCGEGIFGDNQCVNPQNFGRGFGISLFISTPTGVGIMAALSFYPLVMQWLHGVGNEAEFCVFCADPAASKSWGYWVIWLSLLVFQVFYGLFLAINYCVSAGWHAIFTFVFKVAIIIHFGAIAFTAGIKRPVSITIVVLTLLCLISVLVGYEAPVGSDLASQYAFWIGQCIAVTGMFGMTPMLAIYRYLYQD